MTLRFRDDGSATMRVDFRIDRKLLTEAALTLAHKFGPRNLDEADAREDLTRAEIEEALDTALWIYGSEFIYRNEDATASERKWADDMVSKAYPKLVKS